MCCWTSSVWHFTNPFKTAKPRYPIIVKLKLYYVGTFHNKTSYLIIRICIFYFGSIWCLLDSKKWLNKISKLLTSSLLKKLGLSYPDFNRVNEKKDERWCSLFIGKNLTGMVFEDKIITPFRKQQGLLYRMPCAIICIYNIWSHDPGTFLP